MGYRIVRHLARALLALFYHRIEVTGLEHVPAHGPLIVAANHHNALVDPMLLLAAVPRRLAPLAKAPLFRHPLIGPFLWLVGALAVDRRQEGGTDPARNAGLFAAATGALRRGGGILIFPEGVSQPEPVLMTVRTGTARMLLETEAAGPEPAGVTLLPVGLVFHEPGTFRAGRALVLIGPPVPTADCVALHATAPEAAVRQLTDRLAQALARQFVEADDRGTLGLLRVVEAVWQQEHPGALGSEPARVARMQEAMAAYRQLRARDPERAAALRGRVEAYARDLETAGMAGADLSRTYPARTVLRYAVREGGALLLGLAPALVGIALHVVPYRLTGAVVRWLARSADEEATDKIAAGVVLYPVCWLAEGWLAAWLGGGWAVAIFAAVLLPAGFFAIAWRQRLDRVRRDARAFGRFLVAPDLAVRLLARRRALVDELAALAASPPPAGSASPTRG
jgi:1-acyl-sn-glycerol-3-phosphate acyltransferase